MRRLNVLVWHVHGAYLHYLTHAPHNFFVPSRPDRSGDYVGKWGHIPWRDNVVDVPAESVRELDLDCVVFQRPSQFLNDRFEILSPGQQLLPKIYVEHDPPLEHPTETRHFIDDPDTLLVHVTPFNGLMWDSNRTPTTVIDHGVPAPDAVRYAGDLERGLVAINNPATRKRRLGYDQYRIARESVPLDLVGMGTTGLPGGLGEVIHRDLPAFEARYRFLFNPIRYTSLGLAVVEAMMLGLPVVGFATTEMATAVKNGATGFVDTDLGRLIDAMRELLRRPSYAAELGRAARAYAMERFHIDRFVRDWNAAFALATGAPGRARGRILEATA